mmetsp:Transcript_616/g.1428  ORF Transcript_616/g.1428 Transcript_616/m.1428 type:complete len:238 (+) Transcript_616:299-1012(+)
MGSFGPAIPIPCVMSGARSVKSAKFWCLEPLTCTAATSTPLSRDRCTHASRTLRPVVGHSMSKVSARSSSVGTLRERCSVGSERGNNQASWAMQAAKRSSSEQASIAVAPPNECPTAHRRPMSRRPVSAPSSTAVLEPLFICPRHVTQNRTSATRRRSWALRNSYCVCLTGCFSGTMVRVKPCLILCGGRRISGLFGMNLCSMIVLSGSTFTDADPSECSGQITTKPCDARSTHTPE